MSALDGLSGMQFGDAIEPSAVFAPGESYGGADQSTSWTARVIGVTPNNNYEPPVDDAENRTTTNESDAPQNPMKLKLKKPKTIDPRAVVAHHAPMIHSVVRP